MTPKEINKKLQSVMNVRNNEKNMRLLIIDLQNDLQKEIKEKVTPEMLRNKTYKKNKLKKEVKTDKEWINEGHRWHFDFYMGLGYRICENESDIIALAKTMKNILKKHYEDICHNKDSEKPIKLRRHLE